MSSASTTNTGSQRSAAAQTGQHGDLFPTVFFVFFWLRARNYPVDVRHDSVACTLEPSNCGRGPFRDRHGTQRLHPRGRRLGNGIRASNPYEIQGYRGPLSERSMARAKKPSPVALSIALDGCIC